jgi:DNA-binding NarL/FixJ family response regulator
MDIEMPFMDGYEATRQIRASKVPARILILSMRTEERDVQQAAQCGAIGYLIKNCSREELVGAIRAANDGNTASSPEVAHFFPRRD